MFLIGFDWFYLVLLCSVLSILWNMASGLFLFVLVFHSFIMNNVSSCTLGSWVMASFSYCVIWIQFSYVLEDCLWLSLVVFGYLWLSLVIFGYLWLFFVFFGYLWISLVIFGYLWLSLVIFGSLRLSWVVLDYLRVSKGFIWLDSLRFS